MIAGTKKKPTEIMFLRGKRHVCCMRKLMVLDGRSLIIHGD